MGGVGMVLAWWGRGVGDGGSTGGDTVVGMSHPIPCEMMGLGGECRGGGSVSECEGPGRSRAVLTGRACVH